MHVTGPERGPHTLKGWLPWAVVGAVMVVLAGVAVASFALGGPAGADDAETVQDVADLAVDSAEGLDVESGIDLLCEAPMSLYRESLMTMIDDAQERSGTDTPAVDYAISDVADGAEGSFVVDVSSSEEGLRDSDATIRVFVETRDGRSCISGVGDEDDARQEVRISGRGYTRATSPSTSPSR